RGGRHAATTVLAARQLLNLFAGCCTRLRFTVTRRHTALPACDPHDVPQSPLDAPISAQRLARFTGGRPTFRRRPNHAIKGK
ncbi:hypothetical protein, partial [Burkholderia ubonensis]|uniref:hypothetical protein n=1 Tax=Burkholderia ubonensis TaxID=101571 RepID=UPI001E3CBC21